MTPLRRIAFIGNSLPRRCGIATFTTDLQQAISASRANMETTIVAMTDHGRAYGYPSSVGFEVNESDVKDYARAAEYLNAGRFEVVSLQHEFGIFGGEAGNYVTALLSRLTAPIITTLHTVLSEPTPAQRRVTDEIVGLSSKVIVMAEKGRELLQALYQLPPEKIEVIAHGIPDFAFMEPDRAKEKFGFSGKPVILTFGLLSPNKGIEIMIDAMPSILESQGDAMYVVLGTTHPNLVLQQGEAYRESLLARVRALGIEDHVVFLDQFVDRAILLDYISMCDVYVTPYLNQAQMTSGTLAYSFGLGKPVVSTPYWHARELLADGRGILVPFGDSKAIGMEIARLLTNGALRQSLRERAYSSSRSMTWEKTAEHYLAVFEGARRIHPLKIAAEPVQIDPGRESVPPPEMKFGHLLSMSDDTGLFQHAIRCVPDRSHGYCVDDNARALLLASMLSNFGVPGLPEALTARLAAFVQHAWNPQNGRFRNFMSFARNWLEECGSEDSHGRTLWALGVCALSDASPSRRAWAAALFTEALSTAERFSSPRAWAFTLLGLDAFCATATPTGYAENLQHILAGKLVKLLSDVTTQDWVWFEESLSYDNARLSQALIATGVSTGTPSYVEAGLRSLRWLMGLQTTSAGLFRPVGSQSFGRKRESPLAFDQQPLEAAATISACLAAWRADGDTRWKTGALHTFAWFLGANDLSLPLVDSETGGCRDGLHPDRVNENQGG